MNDTRQFVEEIAWQIVTQVAPDEEPLFEPLLEAYFADPTPPDLSVTPPDDPLSMGLDEVLVAVTPAATAVVAYALTFFSERHSTSLSDWRQLLDYDSGLQHLLNRIPPHHPRHAEALVYQQRLTENIDQARRHGDTEISRSERSRIIEQLNDLAQDTVGESFNTLCGMDGGVSEMEWQQMHAGGIEVAQQFGVQEEMAEQVTEAMMGAFLAVLWGKTNE